MKPLSVWIAVLLVLVLSLGAAAGDSIKVDGEVLYHQDFSKESQICDSGIRKGTQSSVNSAIGCAEDFLSIRTYDKGRVYAILPEFSKESTYTIEFSFRFSEIKAPNGYIGMILTCRGEEPTNVTSLLIRADGTVDGFETPCANIMEALNAGREVNVLIPVRSGVVTEILMISGEFSCMVECENIIMVDQGQLGFVVRNADVEVSEIYVVHGVDYMEKSGYFSDSSYSQDGETDIPVGIPGQIPVEDGMPEYSPDTADGMILLIGIAVVSATGLAGKHRKSRE